MSAAEDHGEVSAESALQPALRRWMPIAAAAAVLALAALATALAWSQYSDARHRAEDDLRARVVLTGGILNAAFGQDISTLSAVAQSPAVVAGNRTAMLQYFRRVQPRGRRDLFTAGLGWVDPRGVLQVSSTQTAPQPGANVADRTYFRKALRTGKPYVSNGLVARGSRNTRIVTIAVPTRDARGRISGVLVGAVLLRPTQPSRGTAALGLQGVAIFDRSGQSLLAGFAHPRNGALLARVRRGEQGVIAGTRGFDGAADHVVAYDNVPAAGWTVALDRSGSSLFAAARRTLVLQLALIAAIAAVLLAIAVWVAVRARRLAARQRVRELLRSELARTLGATTSVSEVCHAVASAVEGAFPAALGVLAMTVGDDGRLRVSASSPGSVPARLASADEILARAAALADPARRVTAIETRGDLRQRLGSLDAAVAGAAGSVYLLPLLGGTGERSGVLVLLFGTEHGLDADEQSLIASHAEQAARALERARVQEREHTVAVTLQRSLLSESLPTVESLELAARYEAGSTGLEVGGDWYDVVVRPDGIVLATVGDVAGRGVTAATLMGRLRGAFRAYAYDHSSPADILRRLARHVGDDEMATAVVLALDPYTRQLAYASAGHLPMVLSDVESGATQLLETAGGPPLGALPLADVSFAEAQLALAPRAALVAYTDGLIERRDDSIDRGIELVRSVMTATRSLPADAVAGRMLEAAAARAGGEDDVALLVLRSVGVPRRMDVELPAGPAAPRGLRRRMHAWLTLHGVSAGAQADAVLAVSEACNNSIEHAYADGRGGIHVSLELDDGRLRMCVEDRGRWRLDAERGPERGRGLPIMRGLMHQVEIERRADGTRVRLEQLLERPLEPLASVERGAVR